MTVEEILVKFTGDASSFVNASNKAKAKTKDTSDELLKLNRIMQVAKAGTAGYEQTLAKLEKTSRKYVETLDKIKKQENKAGGGGFLQSFAIGAGVAATQIIGQIIQKVILPPAEKFAKQMLGLEEILRKNDEEILRSATLDHDRSRVFGNRGLGESRIAGQMINPETGEVQTDRQAQFWREKQERSQRELEAANRRVELARNDLRKKDTYGRLLPGVGTGQQMEYEDAQREEKSALAEVERLKGQRDSEMNRAADLEAGGDVFQRMGKQSKITIAKASEESSLLGIRRAEADAIRIENRIKRAQEDSGKGAFLLEDEGKLRSQLQAEYKALEDLDKKKEQTSINDRLRDQRAARGFSGYEAEVLKRRAQGNFVGASELMQLGDEDAAANLKDRLMTPFERGMKEKERIDRIRDQLDPETYQRAMAEIDKGMRGPGPAASRAATGYGSAEHSARMYAYGQVMTQPATQKANIDRLANEPGKTADKQTEANNYLRSIRDSIKGKKTVEVQPANLGGG